MSSRTYLLRLIIPFTLMMIAIVVLSGFLIYNAGLTSERQEQIEEMQGNSRHLAYLLSKIDNIADPVLLDSLKSEAEHRKIRYSLIDETGKVVFDTEVPLSRLNNHNNRPEIVQARASDEGNSVRVSDSQGVYNIYSAQKVDNHPGLIARASRVQRPPLEVSGRMIAELAGAIVLSILIVTWLATAMQNRWISPVRKLALAADEMAGGKWDTPVSASGNQALKTFAERLAFLGQQAKKQLQDLRQQRTELALLVDSLPDPIILTNSENRVILLNEPAARFLQLTSEQARGEKFFSILGEPRLLDLYERIISPVLPPGVTHMREINALRNNQRYTYQAVAVRMATGVVMVLRDITRLAAAIQMKTDFVANASHELRTPLAAIRLAFDTLEEVQHEDPEQAERCVSMIGGHLKRLEDLIADLLDLSKVENAEFKAELADLRVTDLIAIVRNTMGPLAREKQIELTFDYNPDLHFISDRMLLDLILKNLVENAIKYTPANGKVHLKMAHEPAENDSCMTITVTDTGIGIPKQHLERVFERFYQVDAARTGGAGRGTGLGLAIVKHAANTVGGQIQIQSTVGIGTTVTCKIPDGGGRQSLEESM